MKVRTGTLAVILTGTDLAIFAIVVLFGALVQQKTTFQRERLQLRGEVATASGELKMMRRELAVARTQSAAIQQVVNQRLLGLGGNLSRVAFVVDVSGSMRNGGRWDHVRDVIDTWLRYLPIGQCALVLFADDVEVFPRDGGFLNLNGEEGPANRGAMVARLAEVYPSGNTNTRAALERAYAYAPSALVLATDGFPDSGTNRFDVQMAHAVHALCRMHGRSVPVNVLALGNYFSPQFADFLQQIAEATGGAFLGR